MSRYDGKPLLRLLELYALRAIGHLHPADEAQMVVMAPKLRAIYDRQGEWHEVVAAAVNLPPDLPEAIREMWERNQAIAKANDVTLTPQTFVEMFVDQNLAH